MFTRHKLPKWVTDFPLEMERDALKMVAKSSKGPFDAPREMNFCLYGFRKKTDIQEAMHQFEQKGWACSVQPQGNDPTKFLVTATNRDYRLTEEQFSADMLYFNRMADLYGAGYDGWHASNKTHK